MSARVHYILFALCALLFAGCSLPFFVDGPDDSLFVQLNGIENNGTYYIDLELDWESNGETVTARLQRLDEPTSAQVFPGHEISNWGEENVEYELRFDIRRGSEQLERNYRFVLHGRPEEPIIFGVEDNQVYHDAKQFSWPPPVHPDTTEIAWIRNTSALLNGELQYNRDTPITDDGVYEARVVFTHHEGNTTLHSITYVSFEIMLGGVPEPVIDDGLLDYGDRFAYQPTWTVPDDVVSSHELLHEGQLVTFEPGDIVEAAGDYLLTVTYSVDDADRSTELPFSIGTPLPNILFFSSGATGQTSGNAEIFYRPVTASWSNFLSGTTRSYRVTYWEGQSDLSGDETYFDSDDGDPDEFVMQHDGVYEIRVEYEQHGKTSWLSRVALLRLIPDPDIELSVLNASSFDVTWAPPSEHVETVNVTYMASGAGDDLDFGTLEIDPSGDDATTLAFDFPVLSLYVDVAFVDGDENSVNDSMEYIAP